VTVRRGNESRILSHYETQLNPTTTAVAPDANELLAIEEAIRKQVEKIEWKKIGE
jgi:hypothetical protein